MISNSSISTRVSSLFVSNLKLRFSSPSPSWRASESPLPRLLAPCIDPKLVTSSIGSNRLNSVAFSSRSFTEMATDKKVKVFDSEEDLSEALAKYTADLSDKFVKEKGNFTVVFSGGSLFKSLGDLVNSPYADAIEWAKWHVFWVDERVVPKNHDDSNYKLAYDNFLSKVPIPPENVYAINDTLPADGAADDYEARIRNLVDKRIVSTSASSGFPMFDLILMGMGPDGHVASLFPGHPLVNERSKWVAHITDSPKPPPERITLTFPVINSSNHIALVVCGAGKADVVARALGESDSFDKLPVQMVSPQGEFKWFLDNGAASKL